MLIDQDLIYFVCVAKEKSLSRTSRQLGLSQPALSHGLKRLEEKMGLRLFYRNQSGLTLTEDGKQLYLKSQLLIEQAELIISQLQKTNFESRKISIGMHSAIASYLLVDLYKHFTSQIQITLGTSPHITDLINNGEIDCGIVVNPIKHPSLILNFIGEDEFNIWKGTHNLQHQRIFFDSQNHQSTQLIRKLQQQKEFQKYQLIDLKDFNLIYQMYTSGMGHVALPRRMFKKSPSPLLSTLSSLKDKIYLARRVENRENALIDQLKSCLKF